MMATPVYSFKSHDISESKNESVSIFDFCLVMWFQGTPVVWFQGSEIYKYQQKTLIYLHRWKRAEDTHREKLQYSGITLFALNNILFSTFMSTIFVIIFIYNYLIIIFSIV